MGTRSLYYTHSGQTPLGATFKAALLGVGAGAVLGAIYGAVSYYNPFIYFNFAANLLLGIAIGAAVGSGCLKGHVRSPAQAMMLGALGGCVGIYFNWIAYIFLLFDFQILAVMPAELAFVIGALLEDGVWEMQDIRPTGLALLGIWAGEALMFVGASAVFAFQKVKEASYCESCRDWVRDATVFPLLAPFADARGAIARLEAGDMSPLLELAPAEDGADHLLAPRLLQCLRCGGVNLLTITETRFVGKKREKQEKVIVPRLKISAESAAQLLAGLEERPAEEPVPAESAAGEES